MDPIEEAIVAAADRYNFDHLTPLEVFRAGWREALLFAAQAREQERLGAGHA
jgi:hypothetical protein